MSIEILKNRKILFISVKIDQREWSNYETRKKIMRNTDRWKILRYEVKENSIAMELNGKYETWRIECRDKSNFNNL